jgi:3-oxoadipate enol-lactonase
LEFVVDDLIILLDQLKIEKTVVCGLSMGGFVALRAVERNPDRFTGLVLADTKSEPDSDKSKIGRYQALKTIQGLGLPVFADSFAKQGTSPSTQTERPQVFARAKHMMESNSAAGVSAAVLALTSRTDTTNGLDGIRIPTLGFVAGLKGQF